jgi:hypothetical protein
MAGEEKQAVALCKFCSVGLCKEHLVMLYRQPLTVPQYSCGHNPAGRPERAITAKAVEVDVDSHVKSHNGHELAARR